MTQQGQSPAQRKVRILVVNDTQEILELFRDLLEDEGYEVILFSYAPHEVAEVERAQPDLIIVDVILGQSVVGWQLLDKLRMYRPTAHIPIVVCSAAVREVREMDGYLKSQGIGVVFKPIDIDVLLGTIRTVLQDASKTARAQEQEQCDRDGA